MSKNTASVWRWPLILGIATFVGLLDALLIDNGVARVIAWLLLAVPVSLGVRIALGGLKASGK